jgi:predicted RNA binding protein YcfA (HicA-like mRNA interferase family)
MNFGATLFTRGDIVIDPAMKVRDLIKMLNADGWRQVRVRGSHRQFRHASKPGTITVAGTAISISRRERWRASSY